MSQTFSLVCHEAKLRLWIGQGGEDVMRTFYSGDAETVQRLGRFLIATQGKPLVLLCDDTQEHLWPDGCVEFEGDEPMPQVWFDCPNLGVTPE